VGGEFTPMMRHDQKIAVGLFALIIFSEMIICEVDAEMSLPVHNINTGENFSTIQEIIYDIDTKSGHLIVPGPGIYRENINKSITITSISGNRSDTMVQTSNPKSYVIRITADQVNINSINGGNRSVQGMCVLIKNTADYCLIDDTKMTNNRFNVGYFNTPSKGIYVKTSSQDSLAHRTFIDNTKIGVKLYGTKHTVIKNTSKIKSGSGLPVQNKNTRRYYSTIQDAINESENGHTLIVAPGIYRENIIVNKSVTIRSISGPNYTIVEALAPNKPVFYITADQVRVSGFTIKDATKSAGVLLKNAEFCMISSNRLVNNSWGIKVEYSSHYVRIINNDIKNDPGDCSLLKGFAAGISLRGVRSKIINNRVTECPIGIFLSFTHSNEVRDNNVTNNSRGVYLVGSSDNILEKNKITRNKVGIALEASSNNNTVVSNYIAGNSIYQIHEVNSYNIIKNNKGDISVERTYDYPDHIGLKQSELIWWTFIDVLLCFIFVGILSILPILSIDLDLFDFDAEIFWLSLLVIGFIVNLFLILRYTFCLQILSEIIRILISITGFYIGVNEFVTDRYFIPQAQIAVEMNPDRSKLITWSKCFVVTAVAFVFGGTIITYLTFIHYYNLSNFH